MNARTGERRRRARAAGPELGARRVVEIVPRQAAFVLNWSPEGALIGTNRRMVPGERMRLWFKTLSSPVVVNARVVHAAVVGRPPEGGLYYRAGLAFDLAFDEIRQFSHSPKAQGEVSTPTDAACLGDDGGRGSCCPDETSTRARRNE